jgi:hypothetical protein
MQTDASLPLIPAPLGASGASQLRNQAAIVGALLDEIARYAPGDRRAAALREQLDEEQRRLDLLQQR